MNWEVQNFVAGNVFSVGRDALRVSHLSPCGERLPIPATVEPPRLGFPSVCFRSDERASEISGTRGTARHRIPTHAKHICCTCNKVLGCRRGKSFDSFRFRGFRGSSSPLRIYCNWSRKNLAASAGFTFTVFMPSITVGASTTSFQPSVPVNEPDAWSL